jgi:hypothetical protein
MKLNVPRILAAAGVIGLATLATAAQARVGVSVGIGVPLAAPVYAAPAYAAPVVVAPPQPAYVAPPVAYGYGPQPVYVAPPPPPVYVAPPTLGVYFGPSYGHWHRGRHWR